MNRRILTTLFVFLAIFQITFAQDRSCHSNDYLQEQIQENPQRAIILQNIEDHLKNFKKTDGPTKMNEIYTIPVVVHVVYNTAAQNISDAQIQSQIDILNEDFRRLNSDADNTWPQAADSEIEFCMATVDPNGNPTNGITRTQTSVSSFNGDAVKFTAQGGQDIWDRDQYMNIWVCNLPGFLGYAQFPGGPANTDGIVCTYTAFGNIGTAQAPFNLGRTATHEVGHWLNLYHIWGDGNCNQDDEVADTPASDAANYGCAAGHTSCGSTDMVQNYMDYSDDGCMNLFTAGQNTRMRALFAAGGARVSLLSSPACGSGSSCSTPGGLAANNVTDNSAAISWSAVGDATTYDLDHRVAGGSWSTQTVSGTSTTLSGLSTCTNYEVRVRANCADGSSNYSSAVSFQTTGCPDPCNTPSGLAASSVADNSATASWNASSGAQSYQLQYRQSGGSWTNQTVNGTSYNLSGLSTCTAYEIRVRANCASNNSAYSSIVSFQTTGCSSGCNDNEMTLTITPDDYGSEITWTITSNGTVLYSGGPYQDFDSTPEVIELCLADGCYDFNINDSYGDGICCDWGNGSYVITDANGQTVISGGSYGSGETVEFSAGSGDCNGGGGGGGGDCSYVDIDSNNFDNGWGIWNDGGSDCRRSWRDAEWAYSGDRCVRLRDNTSTSTTTTDNLNLSDYEEITVDFTYIARSMDNSNEDFWLQVSTDGGSSFTTVEEWNRGDEFENDIREFDAVVIPGPFTSTTKLRFRCDASGNSDWVYIDDVLITGCLIPNGNKATTPVVETSDIENEVDLDFEVEKDLELKLFPNPATSQLTMEYTLASKETATVIMTDFSGRIIQQFELAADSDNRKVNVQNFAPGYYLVHLVNGTERITEKLVVVR